MQTQMTRENGYDYGSKQLARLIVTNSQARKCSLFVALTEAGPGLRKVCERLIAPTDATVSLQCHFV